MFKKNINKEASIVIVDRQDYHYLLCGDCVHAGSGT